MRPLPYRNAVCLALLVSTLAFALLTVLATVVPVQGTELRAVNDEFDPRLLRITSLEEATRYVRSSVGDHASDAEIAEGIDTFIRHRFIHDYGTLDFQENWVAWVAANVFRHDLIYRARADDLLQGRGGICSQQTLLFQDMLERFGISYATVGFAPSHMLVGAKIDGRWAVYDADQDMRRNGIVYYDDLRAHPERLVALYRHKPARDGWIAARNAGEQFSHYVGQGRIELKWINEKPAARAEFFHMVTAFASRWGWLVLAYLSALSLFISREPRDAPRRYRLALQL